MSQSKILSTANNDFAANLYQALYPSISSENLVVSPFGLHVVLGMVAQGARGDTRTGLLEGLQFDGDSYPGDKNMPKIYNHVIAGFQKRASSKTFTLLIANRIYSRSGFGLNRKFVQSLKTNFEADLEQLDLSTPFNCEVAADRINKWVEETTKNKISTIINKKILGDKTSLILVNGVYFKGFWKDKFRGSLTTREPFNVTPDHQVNVDMMHSLKNFLYGELPDLKAEAIALPYRGGRLSMVIILPMDVDGLDMIYENLATILEGGKSLVRESLTVTDKIELSLPRFKFTTYTDSLEEWLLQDLEIEAVFTEGSADFSGIPDAKNPKDLHVSNVIQKVVIEVDEDGGDADADAGKAGEKRKMGSSGSSSDGPIISIPFVVDHPFYFQVVDHANADLVLISGHVYDPTEE